MPGVTILQKEKWYRVTVILKNGKKIRTRIKDTENSVIATLRSIRERYANPEEYGYIQFAGWNIRASDISACKIRR